MGGAGRWAGNLEKKKADNNSKSVCLLKAAHKAWHDYWKRKPGKDTSILLHSSNNSGWLGAVLLIPGIEMVSKMSSIHAFFHWKVIRCAGYGIQISCTWQLAGMVQARQEKASCFTVISQAGVLVLPT